MKNRKEIFFIIEMFDEDFTIYHSFDDSRKGYVLSDEFYESLEIGKIFSIDDNINFYKVVDFKVSINETWNNIIFYVKPVEKKLR